MRHKSQVTLFLILGVVILFLVLLLFFGTRRANTEQPLDILFDQASISSYITSCVKDTAEQGLVILGKQGGYLNPRTYVASEAYHIAYLYDQGKVNVPSRAAVEKDLASYIDREMLNCLDNFGPMRRQGWTVTYEAPTTKALINERDITLTQTFLVSVTKDSTLSFGEFTYSVPVRLGYMLDISKEIVDFHLVEPEWTDLTALSRHDVEITIFPYKQKLTYSIKDPQSSIRSQAYMFNFALDFA